MSFHLSLIQKVLQNPCILGELVNRDSGPRMADTQAFAVVRKGDCRAGRVVRAPSKGVFVGGVSVLSCLPLTLVPQSSLVLGSTVGPGRASSSCFVPHPLAPSSVIHFEEVK